MVTSASCIHVFDGVTDEQLRQICLVHLLLTSLPIDHDNSWIVLARSTMVHRS